MGGLALPSRAASTGDVWFAYFDPAVGHEQSGRRPAVVVSGNLLNLIPSELVFLVPLTTANLEVRSHIRVRMSEGDLTHPSFAMTEQIRSMSTLRLRRRVGVVDEETLGLIRYRVFQFMDFR
ncbi:MAG: type II toxin-antitoxin system PemK/MazF family toxin [Thermomicrobiales bacterium]|nr:type II toxin-antitoxin system PemK/MazF family toxin [Thermomicrobiales bacterium]